MTMNPLQELLVGNKRFRDNKTNKFDNEKLREKLSQGQSPIASVIRCADSRVSPEIIFDQPLGSLFVCGVAGNVPTPEIVESLEYAVGPLGCSLIVIMGHTCCGAIGHAIDQQPTEGLFSLVDIPMNAEDPYAFNAEQGIPKILSFSPFIEEKVLKGDVQIVAGVYDITSGMFDLVAQTKLESLEN